MPPEQATTEHIVLLLQQLQQTVQNNHLDAKDRIEAVRTELTTRLTDILTNAQTRAAFYNRRDEEQTAKFESISIKLAGVAAIGASVDRLSGELAEIVEEIDSLRKSYEHLEARLIPIEECRTKVEQHIVTTEKDHVVVSRWRLFWHGVVAFALALGLIAGIVGGFSPLVDYIWPHTHGS
jgi:chromosome segregation ATPase